MNLFKNPGVMIQCGMLMMVVALSWQRYADAVPGMPGDLFDASCGLLFGISIGLNLLSVWRLRSRRTC